MEGVSRGALIVKQRDAVAQGRSWRTWMEWERATDTRYQYLAIGEDVFRCTLGKGPEAAHVRFQDANPV